MGPVTVAELTRPIAPPALRAPAVVARRTARAAARSGVLWGYVFGAFVVSSAWSYSSIYATQAARHALAAAFGANNATKALFGPAPALETTGGFTVLKVSMTVMLIGAVWGLLTATRLLRGEEDAGRWDLLLSGQATPRGATTEALVGLGAAAAVMWAVTAAIIAVAGAWSRVGIGAGDACFLALALVSTAVMFLSVGALTSQLAPTRRLAAGYAAVVLGVAYALRMVGDAGLGLHWLTWISPLGWVEQLAPLTADNPAPLALIALFTVALGAVSVIIAGARDAGSSLVRDHSHAPARLGLLGGQLGLSVRLLRGLAVSWLVTLAVVGFLFGMVAHSAGTTFSGSSVKEVLDKLGATGGGAGAYLGVTFLMVAVLIGFIAAGQIGAARAEESEGRLDNLMVQPVSRSHWLSGRLALALALVAAGGVVAGVCTWLGTATQPGAGDPTQLLAAGVNAAVPAVFVLGIGALLLGLWPRAALAGSYAVLGWSLFVELVGGIGAVSHWLLDTSVFHHVAAAPAVPVDWVADGVLVALGVVAGSIGLACFARRDLQVD